MVPSQSTHICRSIICAISIAYVCHCAKGFHYALFLSSLSRCHNDLWPYHVMQQGDPATGAFKAVLAKAACSMS